MTSVIKYFKKKIQPLKRCVTSNCSPLSNNEMDISLKKVADFEIDSKTITKKKHKKRAFKLRLKRSIKQNLDEVLKESKHLETEANKNDKTEAMSHNYDEKSEGITPDSILFNSPVSSNQSSKFYFAKPNNQTDFGESNFILSSVDGDFFTSTHSNIDQKRSSTSTYDVEGFAFDSVSNSSPANNSDSSMVTYNTKYAHSNYSNDDGLMSNSLIRQPSISISSNVQQSTPYCESMTKNRNFKMETRKSHIGCFKEKDETEDLVKRSNTTYTLANTKSNKSSKIIEYFSNIEMSKPSKRKANSRHANVQDDEIANDSVCSKRSKSEKLFSDYNEIEKNQNDLFNDSSLNGKTNQSVLSPSQRRNTGLYKYLGTITPPSSSTETSDSSSNQEKTNLSSISNESTQLKVIKSNDTHSIQNSVEKVRRTLSLPGLVNDNSMNLVNVSKISSIKSPEAATTKSESTQKIDETNEGISNMTETLVNKSNKDSTRSSFGNGDFIRGEPGNRSSKNIKRMFKNVIKQQMNALSNLEKFYEAQVSRLETDREQNLKLNPINSSEINEFFDRQLKMLEERVQTNLKFLSENKCTKITSVQPNDQNAEEAKKILTHKISQLMLLKQLQQSQKQVRTKALVDLKNNIINQNNLLPSKSVLVPHHQSKRSFVDLNESNFHETMFKRHLSLPFKQCRNNPLSNLDRNTQMISRSRSPRMSNLAYSTSRAKYGKQMPTANATSSPLVAAAGPETKTSTQFQYQKNITKKFSTSTENVSQLRKQSMENLYDTAFKSFCNSELSSNKVDASTIILASKYAQVKRQNKSVSSIKSEDSTKISFQDESDRFHLSAFLKNNSLFNTNISGFECQNHLVKYAAPRLSDGHIQYRIKMASKINDLKQNGHFQSNQLRFLNPNCTSSLNDTKTLRKNSGYVIETEV